MNLLSAIEELYKGHFIFSELPNKAQIALVKFREIIHQVVIPALTDSDELSAVYHQLHNLTHDLLIYENHKLQSQYIKLRPTQHQKITEDRFNLFYDYFYYLSKLQSYYTKETQLSEHLVYDFNQFFFLATQLFNEHCILPVQRTERATNPAKISVTKYFKERFEVKIKNMLNVLFHNVLPHPLSGMSACLSEANFATITACMPLSMRQYIMHNRETAQRLDRHPLDGIKAVDGVPIFAGAKVVDSGRNNAREIPNRLAKLRLEGVSAHIISDDGLDGIVTQVHAPLYIAFLESRSKLATIFGTSVPVDIIQPDFENPAAGETVIDSISYLGACETVNSSVQTANFLAHSKQNVALQLARPPGHHAGYGTASGFCLFNNIIITAKALRRINIPVLIIDFDIHHGDGTFELMERCFFNDKHCFFLNFYNPDIWPYPEKPEELSNTLNIALKPKCSSEEFFIAYDLALAQLVTKGLINPFILWSAGLHGHKKETIAGKLGWKLESEDYGTIISKASVVFPHSKMLAVLEGGYVAAAIADSIPYLVKSLAQHDLIMKNFEKTSPLITHSMFQSAAASSSLDELNINNGHPPRST